jgi:hypothetical protein
MADGHRNELHRDRVTQGVQQGVDVSLDAWSEQLHDPPIVAEFGDLILQGHLNGRRHLRESILQPGRGFGDVAGCPWGAVNVGFCHGTDARPHVLLSLARRIDDGS